MDLRRNRKVEIMAPVGSYGALAAAYRAGADAVYFGVGELNMRSRAAANFAVADLAKIAEKCRRLKMRSYLALNTLVYNRELPEIRKILAVALNSGISAVIAADIAVILEARKIGLETHISVQLNVANIEAVRYYAQFADVLVLARELTLPEIREIIETIKTEQLTGPSGNLVKIEIFAHGALCVAVSGKCYMSLSVYNTSANRGACYQNCRRSYRVIDEQTGTELEIDNRFVMSPKDICVIPFIEEILEAGVDVLKIEGRGRPEDYVYTVTKVYRQAVDKWQQGEEIARDDKKRWMSELNSVFNRGFWEGGYYLGEKMGEWCGVEGNRSPLSKTHIGEVSNYFSKLQVAEITLSAASLEVGQDILVTGPTSGAVNLTVTELRLDRKRTDAASKGDIVSVPVPCKVRRNDKVYLIEKRKFGVPAANHQTNNG